MTRSNALRLGILAGSGMMLAATGIAYAQDYGADYPPPAQEQIQVDDNKLEAFVDAQGQLVHISEKWNARMQEADSPQAQQQMREQAQSEMVTAVEESGLTVQEYNEIATAAQTDPELQAKLHELSSN